MRKTGRHTSFAPKGGTPRDERALPDRTDTAPAPPERGAYDRKTVYAILDELRLPCGPCRGWKPARHPHALRDRDLLYLHGSPMSAALAAPAAGSRPVSVTLVDGLVLARSMMYHSMNYRSIVAFGRARAVAGAKRRRNPADYFRTPRAWTLERRGRRVRRNSERRSARLPALRGLGQVRSRPAQDLESDIGLPWGRHHPLRVAAGSHNSFPRAGGRRLPGTCGTGREADDVGISSGGRSENPRHTPVRSDKLPTPLGRIRRGHVRAIDLRVGPGRGQPRDGASPARTSRRRPNSVSGTCGRFSKRQGRACGSPALRRVHDRHARVPENERGLRRGLRRSSAARTTVQVAVGQRACALNRCDRVHALSRFHGGLR